MKTKLVKFVFGLGLLQAVAGISCVAAQAATTTLALVERPGIQEVIDIGASGDSAGDMLTYSNELFDSTGSTKVGSNHGWCVRILPGKLWECVGTFKLADGQLTLEGPYVDGADSSWAITGGAGAYASTRGEMLLHARNKESTEFDMVFGLID